MSEVSELPTLFMQPLLEYMYLTDQFKTLQLLGSWSEDMHMVLILSLDYFYTCFLGVSDLPSYR